MKGRIILYLIALVVVPTAILSIMAGRAVRIREQDLERRVEMGATRAMNAVKDNVLERLRAAHSDVVTTTAGLVAEGRLGDMIAESGRLKLRHPFIDLVFVARVGEGLLYPPEQADGAGAEEQEPDNAAVLDAALRLQKDGQYAAAVREFEKMLNQPGVSPVARAEAALGAGRCYRKLGELKLAGGVFRQIAGYSAGRFEEGGKTREDEYQVIRDHRGHLYDLIALQELSESYYEAISADGEDGPARWHDLAISSGLELLERLVFLYDRITPAQRDGIMDYLARAGIAADRNGGGPGAALASNELLGERTSKLLVLFRAQAGTARLKPSETMDLHAVIENEISRSGIPTNMIWLVVRDSVYSAGALPDSAEIIAGFRVNPAGFRQTVGAAAERIGAERDMIISLQHKGGDAPVVMGLMSWPFNNVMLRVYLAQPGPLGRNRELMIVLQEWGILVLAVGVIAGAWIVLRQSFGEVKRLQDRSDFIAGVSHDLRTPLASMRMLAESLALERVDPSRRKQFLETIISEAGRLGHLVERVLYFVRFGDDVLTYQLRRVDVGPVVREAVESFAGIVSGREGIRVRVETESGLPEVMADPLAISQVVLNLVDNAVKYSAGNRSLGGGVEVRVAANVEGGVDISVSDSGIGIDKKEVGKIFRRFYRARNARGHSAPGIGLGLALCRHIVRGHGGRIEVRSASGRGSVFTVSLPRA